MTKKKPAKPKPATLPLEGQLWAVPVPGMGFAPLVVGRAPAAGSELDFAFAYVLPSLSTSPPSPADIPPLDDWRHAWIGLVPTLPFRKGRWTLCGRIPKFDRELWPVPPCRNSAVREDKPVEEWGRYPWGEMWSIEITGDEPTMTVISNEPATRELALRFPTSGVVNAGSRLEKSLVQYFKKRRASFWEMELDPQPILPGAPARWAEHAAKARAKWPGNPPGWLPAGRTTDRNMRAGMWMGMPLTGGGFGAAILIEKPPSHQRLFSDAVVMGMRRKWDTWPTLADVRELRPEDGALVTQTSLIVVRDGRWRVIGEHPGFDPAQWVWPLPWRQLEESAVVGVVEVQVGGGKSAEFRVDPAVLALDPDAGRRCSGSRSGYGIELEIPRLIDGTSPCLNESGEFKSGVVTPERLIAWRAINAAVRAGIERATTRKSSRGRTRS